MHFSMAFNNTGHALRYLKCSRLSAGGLLELLQEGITFSTASVCCMAGEALHTD